MWQQLPGNKCFSIQAGRKMVVNEANYSLCPYIGSKRIFNSSQTRHSSPGTNTFFVTLELVRQNKTLVGENTVTVHTQMTLVK
jgi:hypothetical protein